MVPLAILLLPMVAVHVAFAATTKGTFSIDYVVTISDPAADVADVRIELAGVEEIKTLTLHPRHQRFSNWQATGKLEWHDKTAIWTPGSPYAHFSYRVRLDHPRGQHGRFDSYAGGSWVVTRARELFPSIRVETHPRPGFKPKSRARLLFRLPSGWQSAAALPQIAPSTYSVEQAGKILDRPRGWFALGRFKLDRQDIAGIMVQLVRIPGSALSSTDLFGFLERTLPALQKLLLSEPETVLIVSAPDPLWHGGISGTASFYMHGNRPLRTPDKTSPYLHELFHVLQPYSVAADADWLAEGLAEFYSLELQRRAGLLDDAAFTKGLSYFERYGRWNVDLRQQQDNAATNNSAPLVLYALDQRIQRSTSGKMRLDDVVTRLAQQGGVIDTARFFSAVNEITSKKFTKFFERHVIRGERPARGAAQ
jgi:hypothetical protein